MALVQIPHGRDKCNRLLVTFPVLDVLSQFADRVRLVHKQWFNIQEKLCD
jgi:hypothetical protein